MPPDNDDEIGDDIKPPGTTGLDAGKPGKPGKTYPVGKPINPTLVPGKFGDSSIYAVGKDSEAVIDLGDIYPQTTDENVAWVGDADSGTDGWASETGCDGNLIDEGCGCGEPGPDACGVCGGNNSTCTDCAGYPWGDTLVDACGTCGGDIWNEEDCFPTDETGLTAVKPHLSDLTDNNNVVDLTDLIDIDEPIIGEITDKPTIGEIGSIGDYDDNVITPPIYGCMDN